MDVYATKLGDSKKLFEKIDDLFYIGLGFEMTIPQDECEPIKIQNYGKEFTLESPEVKRPNVSTNPFIPSPLYHDPRFNEARHEITNALKENKLFSVYFNL